MLQSSSVGGFLSERLAVLQHRTQSRRTWLHYHPDAMERCTNACELFFISNVADVAFEN